MYAKLFKSIYQGTLRGKSHPILVFTNMLANADARGVVETHPRAIAEEVGLTLEEVREALQVLEAPDEESRSPEEDGRRITRLDDHRSWGWQIVNYMKYRAIRDEDDRREQNRISQANFRARQAAARAAQSAGHADSNQSKPRKPESAQAEGEAEAEGEGEASQQKAIVTGPAPSAPAPATAALVGSPVPADDPTDAMVDFFADDLKGHAPAPEPKPEREPPPPFNGLNDAAIPARAVVLLAKDFELPEEWGKDAVALGWPARAALREAEKFRQFWTTGKGQGTRRGVKGWRQSWSNWLDKAAKMSPHTLSGGR